MRPPGLGLLLALLTLPTPLTATTIYVDPCGGGDSYHIQPGLDAAADGDTVLVAPGTYAGHLDIDLSFHGRAVTLISEAGPAATVIDCEGADHGMRFDGWETPHTVVDGFTITNGWGVRGGGIWVLGSSPTIRNCVITECSADEAGGGVAVDGGSPTFTDCVIERSASELGGGLSSYGSLAYFEDCLFSRNHGYRGGAAHLRYAPAPTFTGCRFEDNESDVSGGCAYIFGSSPVFDDCSFQRNRSGWSAILRGEYSSPMLTNCWFAYNWSFGEQDRGHTIDLYHSDIGEARIEDCTFCAWNLSGTRTWQLFFEDCGATVERCVIAYNTQGGAAGCVGTIAPTFRHCITFSNLGGDELCGIQEDNMVADPLFCNMWVDDLTVEGGSPCLPANNPWGVLVGRFGEGCEGDDSYVAPTSWGAIKAMYR